MSATCPHCYGHGKNWRIMPKPEGWAKCGLCRGTGQIPAWLQNKWCRRSHPAKWAAFSAVFRQIYGRRPAVKRMNDRLAFALFYAGWIARAFQRPISAPQTKHRKETPGRKHAATSSQTANSPVQRVSLAVRRGVPPNGGPGLRAGRTSRLR